jgi:uncharacterized membrane protein
VASRPKSLPSVGLIHKPKRYEKLSIRPALFMQPIGCASFDASFSYSPGHLLSTIDLSASASGGVLPYTADNGLASFFASSGNLLASMDQDTAEAIAGPLFGASLFPYLAFLFFLSREENDCPKGVTVGFATCLLFVFLTIPAAIAAKLLYGVSLADCDWLHGSAESLLTVTNLVTVVAFRQALSAKEAGLPMPESATSYAPMTWLVLGLTAAAAVTALVPALSNPDVHTPYLGGWLDLPVAWHSLLLPEANPEPDNALSIPCWIIHVSSLVEFLVAMGFIWRWADVVQNQRWKGLTWGLLPLHSSGIAACTYHVFYNHVAVMVPVQAFLTCIGNATAALAALRIAQSNGWKPAYPSFLVAWLGADFVPPVPGDDAPSRNRVPSLVGDSNFVKVQQPNDEANFLVGFEDLGQALANDNDYSFLIKLFVGSSVGSYVIKYGETFFSFPYEPTVSLSLVMIGVPSLLNAYKWYRRSQDPSFEGWF